MGFEWDKVKCRINVAKHGIDFADAVAVFEDPLAVSRSESQMRGEQRFLALGQDGFGRLLVVCYSERGQNIRIISARLATKGERNAYEG